MLLPYSKLDSNVDEYVKLRLCNVCIYSFMREGIIKTDKCTDFNI